MSKITTTKAAPNIFSLLQRPDFKAQLANVLPKTMTPERMVRIALTELRMNPKLGECDPMSFLGAVMRCAQIGLEPSSEKQHVYLIPFKNYKSQKMECQVIIGYRGFLSLGLENNVFIETDIVCENDTFEFQKGIDTKLKLIPALDGERGDIKGAYAMARICLPDSTHVFMSEYMSKAEIDKVMLSSKSSASEGSIWKQHYDAMARKTVIRRLFKYIPLSSTIEAAVVADELADNGNQNNSKLFDLDLTQEVTDKTSDTSSADILVNKLTENTEKSNG